MSLCVPSFRLLSSLAASFAAAVDFQREVRPILSDACFHCHGPDKSTRMAGLRLDTREGAFARTQRPELRSLPASRKQASSFSASPTSTKPRRMPPESSHKTLTPKQIDTLKRWVAEGAPWKEHWSFTAPVRPTTARRREQDLGRRSRSISSSWRSSKRRRSLPPLRPTAAR